MRIFISHATVDSAVAKVLRDELARLGHEAFVASEDIQAGQRWEAVIDAALAKAERCIVLCSWRSVASAWVWMELGAARVRQIDPIPVLLPELRREDLPDVLQGHQLVELAGPAACQALAKAFGTSLADGGQALYDAIVQASDWRSIRPGLGGSHDARFCCPMGNAPLYGRAAAMPTCSARG